ncbi:hypothetical protein IEO21_09726 [Rhodonia placenta]|uniref:Fungal pheromone STE3G-protein-coupled receptor n=1 Tax=Rhodonia placenta TaxID=104341 RepID=A0A8H7TXM3_9APHY|nr:hypothetical protein IEO21_09726 [Postia placenta]
MPATLSAGAFIAAVLVLIPLPSHWRARNVATLSLIAWLFVVNVIYGVNTSVWNQNAEVRLIVWCDITTKIIIGANSALPACTLCICKHLELIASGRAVRLTHEDKRRRMFFELAMCFGVPMMLMALQYVVQGHRFDIVEDIGCQPATYYSIPAVFIVWFPPLLFSTITLIYASIALLHFFRQRLTFAAHLRDANSSLNTSRYLRLIAMSITEIVWGTSFTALAMYDNISPGLRPWVSWNYVHSNFSRMGQFALVEFTATYIQQLFLFYWAIPASSYIFFLFFGFGEETMKDYSRVLVWVRCRVLRRQEKHDRSPLSSLPVKYVSQPHLLNMRAETFTLVARIILLSRRFRLCMSRILGTIQHFPLTPLL